MHKQNNQYRWRNPQLDRNRTTLDQKLGNKMSANEFAAFVERQPLGNAVIWLKMEEESNIPALCILKNASDQFSRFAMEFKLIDGLCSLEIDGITMATGKYSSLSQRAKKELSVQALEKLKEYCFFLYTKDMVSVTDDQVFGKSAEPEQPPALDCSNAGTQMMLKMGWKGGGLGSNEQGRKDIVEAYQRVNRVGLGSRNILNGVKKVLEDYKNSSRIVTLIFDSSFTKEERMTIHMFARRWKLKTKSIRIGDDRRITVRKPLDNMMVVRYLLNNGGEDEAYKLEIPTKYAHLFTFNDD